MTTGDEVSGHSSVLELSAGLTRLILNPSKGGRAQSLTIDGLEILGKNEDASVGWGCFPMVPWPGRLKQNSVTWKGETHPMPPTYGEWALHGLAHQRSWRVLSHGDGAAMLGIRFGGEEGDPWPWPTQIESGWHLYPDHLDMTLVGYPTDGDAPLELGWHPWLRRKLDRGSPMELGSGLGRMFVRGSDLLPTGELIEPPAGPYGDCFEVTTGQMHLRWPGALDLTIDTDCGYATIFTHLADLACVEPQSGPPDWINRYPVTVNASHPRTARSTWTWTTESS